MFTIVIENSNGEVIDEHSFEDGEFIAGRSQHCDIILPSPNISRRHARIFVQGGSAFVEDLGSSNGVYVGGFRISGTTDLGLSAQMRIGDFILHLEGTEPVQEDVNICYGRLTVMSSDGPGRVFWLTETSSSVGRGRDASITILDPSISRLHARLNADSSGRVFLEDLNASNGTYINGQRVSTAEVRPGDMIRLGHQDILFEGAPGDQRGYPRNSSSHFSVHEGSSSSVTMIIALLVLLIGGGAAVLTFVMMNRSEDDSPKPENTGQIQTEPEAPEKSPDEIEEEFRSCLRRARRGRAEGDLAMMKSGVDCANKHHPSDSNVLELKNQLVLEEHWKKKLDDAIKLLNDEGRPCKATRILQKIDSDALLYGEVLRVQKQARERMKADESEFRKTCEKGSLSRTGNDRCRAIVKDMLELKPTDTTLLKYQRRWKR